jgi:hypothetical protein
LLPLFATGVNDTGGKFAVVVVDTGGNLPPASLTPVANLPPVSLTPAANLPPFASENGGKICHRYQRHRWQWCTLTREYLREFSKKFETV